MPNTIDSLIQFQIDRIAYLQAKQVKDENNNFKGDLNISGQRIGSSVLGKFSNEATPDHQLDMMREVAASKLRSDFMPTFGSITMLPGILHSEIQLLEKLVDIKNRLNGRES